MPEESPKGFITAPTLEQLKPTDEEMYYLECLLQWQEQSAKSTLILGKPIQPEH